MPYGLYFDLKKFGGLHVVYMLNVEGRLQQPSKGCVIKESDHSGSCNMRFLFTKKNCFKDKRSKDKANNKLTSSL